MAKTMLWALTLLGIVAYAAAHPYDEAQEASNYDTNVSETEDSIIVDNDAHQDENEPDEYLDIKTADSEPPVSLETTRSLEPSDQMQNYIIQGRKDDVLNAPWVVHLRITNPEGLQFSCGGSIIDPFWIVTAAHCVGNATEIEVIMGATNSWLSPNAVTRKADQYFVHPQYVREEQFVNGILGRAGNRFDVALIRVAQEIESDSGIQSIKIEDQSWTGELDEMFTAYGWGQTMGEIRGSTSETLRSVRIPVLSMNYCHERFKFEIGAEMICAGSTDRGVCKGDSGGPLVNENNNLVGVVSFGTAKCNSYSLFTNLADPGVNSWIMETGGFSSQ